MKGLIVFMACVMNMAFLCEKILTETVKSLLENNHALAEHVLETEKEITKKEHVLEDSCMKFLMKQTPVAKDLRKVSASSKIICNMGQVARKVRSIAEIVLQTNLPPYAKNEHLQALTKASLKMFSDSVDAYVHADCSACEAVIAYDSVADELFEKLKVALLILSCKIEKKLKTLCIYLC